MENDIAAKEKVLLTREQIEERAAEIGKQIASDYGEEPVYLICTLKGAVVWMADLMKSITNDTEIDFYFRLQLWFGHQHLRHRQDQKRLRWQISIIKMSSSWRISRYRHHVEISERKVGGQKAKEHSHLYAAG